MDPKISFQVVVHVHIMGRKLATNAYVSKLRINNLHSFPYLLALSRMRCWMLRQVERSSNSNENLHTTQKTKHERQFSPWIAFGLQSLHGTAVSLQLG